MQNHKLPFVIYTALSMLACDRPSIASEQKFCRLHFDPEAGITETPFGSSEERIREAIQEPFAITSIDEAIRQPGTGSTERVIKYSENYFLLGENNSLHMIVLRDLSQVCASGATISDTSKDQVVGNAETHGAATWDQVGPEDVRSINVMFDKTIVSYVFDGDNLIQVHLIENRLYAPVPGKNLYR